MKRDMTELEIRAITQSKVEKIKALCDELKVVLSAKQRISENMMIENIVIFSDNENYPMEERAPQPEVTGNIIPENTQPVEVAPEENQNAEPTTI